MYLQRPHAFRAFGSPRPARGPLLGGRRPRAGLSKPGPPQAHPRLPPRLTQGCPRLPKAPAAWCHGPCVPPPAAQFARPLDLPRPCLARGHGNLARPGVALLLRLYPRSAVGRARWAKRGRAWRGRRTPSNSQASARGALPQVSVSALLAMALALPAKPTMPSPTAPPAPSGRWCFGGSSSSGRKAQVCP